MLCTSFLRSKITARLAPAAFGALRVGSLDAGRFHFDGNRRPGRLHAASVGALAFANRPRYSSKARGLDEADRSIFFVKVSWRHHHESVEFRCSARRFNCESKMTSSPHAPQSGLVERIVPVIAALVIALVGSARIAAAQQVPKAAQDQERAQAEPEVGDFGTSTVDLRKRGLDIVLVIDGTGSMSIIIDELKAKMPQLLQS